jgi:peptidoglycan-associated lipoprotein
MTTRITPIARAASLIGAGTAALFLAACANTPLEEKPAAPVTEKSATPSSGAGSAPDPRAVARVDTTPKTVDPLQDPNSPLAKRSVFFDFDSFVVKSEFQGLVEAHGRYLANNKARRIVIEGSTDERGSREYNLALGQKRADALKSRLTLLGVVDGQVETVSLGEEKPRAAGASEEAWAQNRRADIVYK